MYNDEVSKSAPYVADLAHEEIRPDLAQSRVFARLLGKRVPLNKKKNSRSGMKFLAVFATNLAITDPKLNHLLQYTLLDTNAQVYNAPEHKQIFGRFCCVAAHVLWA